eukprot:TRINITY_DN17338_c0_g1_i1.p1 TRINITY_DN17338_c0_g1~~TRINITY_DN17338_c0_g1_i1.p1  ORF type:complete len:1238 (+),score=184.76 TRINITY_DN17338_c0_g1_i1:474-3716(+)
MHASVASHSFGVRLRTRYIRLPIPTLAQLSSLPAKLADFEKTGLRNILRLPFSATGAQARRQPDSAISRASGLASASTATIAAKWSPQRLSSAPSSSSASCRKQTVAFSRDGVDVGNDGVHGVVGDGDEGDGSLRGQHVQLFRTLQAKWICYDAYGRVAMACGVNYTVKSVGYYVIGVLMLQRHSCSAAIALAFVFQSTAAALASLDVVNFPRGKFAVMQLVGCLPTVVTLIALQLGAREKTHFLSQENTYPLAVVAFIFETLYFELQLRLAWPTDDEACLPRHFRAVLFLDIFSDVEIDPADFESTESAGTASGHAGFALSASQRRRFLLCTRTLHATFAALRRWEAIPKIHLSEDQIFELGRLRRQLLVWRHEFASSLSGGVAEAGVTERISLAVGERKSWGCLSERERGEDRFATFLLGPLACGGLYDLEAQQVSEPRAGLSVLTLGGVAELLDLASSAVQDIAGASTEADDGGEGVSSDDHVHESHMPAPRMDRAESVAASLPEALHGQVVGRITPVVASAATKAAPIPGLAARARNGRRSSSSNSSSSSSSGSSSSGSSSNSSSKSGSCTQRRHRTVMIAREDRLPWKAFSCMTRMLQLGWLMIGVLHGVQLYGLVTLDFANFPEEERRRLTAPSTSSVDVDMEAVPVSTPLNFHRLPVQWPHGGFLELVSMSLVQSMGRNLLIGSPAALYWHGTASGAVGTLSGNAGRAPSAGAKPPALQMRRAEPRSAFPPGAIALCSPFSRPSPSWQWQTESHEGGRSAAGCLWGRLEDGGLAIWPYGRGRWSTKHAGAVVLPVHGDGTRRPRRPWLRFTGAALRCREVTALLPSPGLDGSNRGSDGKSGVTTWCLVLAGWDGEGLPLCVVPLPLGPNYPPTTNTLEAFVEAPLPASVVMSSVAHPVEGTSAEVTSGGVQQRRNHNNSNEGRTVFGRTDSSTGGTCTGGCSGVRFDAPLWPPPPQPSPRTSTDVGTPGFGAVEALHLEPASGRLWALLDGGPYLQVWDVRKLHNLGLFQPRWLRTGADGTTSHSPHLIPKTICEDGQDRLLVAAERHGGGPELLRADLPPWLLRFGETSPTF